MVNNSNLPSSTNLTAAIFPNSPIMIPVQFYDIIFNITGCILIGLISFFTNNMALLIIYKNKRLHTPCFQLMAAECFSSVLMAAGIFFSAFDSMGQQIGWFPKKRSRLLCYIYQSTLAALTTTVSVLIACLISIDRLISIIFPIWYRKMGLKYARYSLILCAIYALSAATAGLLIGPDLNSIITCAKFSDAFAPNYNSYYKGVNLFICCACVVVYLIMLVSFQLKARRLISSISNNSKNSIPHQMTMEQKTFAKQQAAVMPAVKLLMILYTLTGVCPTIVGNILTYLDGGIYFARGYQYNYVIKACNPLAEILALMCRSKEFRLSAKRLLQKDEPITALSMGGVSHTNKACIRDNNMECNDL